MTLPPPGPDTIARQVALLRAMGGSGPVPGYSDAERAAARDRIAGVLGRVGDRAYLASFRRPETSVRK